MSLSKTAGQIPVAIIPLISMSLFFSFNEGTGRERGIPSRLSIFEKQRRENTSSLGTEFIADWKLANRQQLLNINAELIRHQGRSSHPAVYSIAR